MYAFEIDNFVFKVWENSNLNKANKMFYNQYFIHKNYQNKQSILDKNFYT